MKRLTALLAAVCLLLCLGLTGCGDDGTGGGFRFPLTAEPKGLDPQTAADTASVTVIATLFEGLTRIDADGAVVPAAADWTVSEDGKTYTFTLRQSYWSTLTTKDEENPWADPTPVTADDFLFAWQRAVDPATGSAVAAEFDSIKNAKAVRTGQKKLKTLGVKAPDQRTLVVTLEQADNNFLSRLATTPFMPCNRAFFEYTGGRYGLEREYLLTNGHFWLAAWNHNESLLLYKHESHHQAAAIAPEAVRYVIGVADPVESLKNGDLDAAPLTAAQVTALGNDGTYVTLQDTVRGLWFNTSADPFTVTHIRTALRDSIQWDALRQLYEEQGGDEVPADGFVPPDATVSGNEPYRTEGNVLPYKTDTKAAKAALARGLNTLEGVYSLQFELLAADDPLSADVARYLVQSWQKNLGVYPTLTLLPEEDLNRRVQSGNYQAAIAIHTPTGLTGGENLACFASGAADNLARLNNQTVDTAIRQAQNGSRKRLETLERTLWQVCPCVPLGTVTRYYAMAEDTEGIAARPFGGGRYSKPLEFSQAKKFD